MTPKRNFIEANMATCLKSQYPTEASLISSIKNEFVQLIRNRRFIDSLLIEKIQNVETCKDEDIVLQSLVLARGTNFAIMADVISPGECDTITSNQNYVFMASINDAILSIQTFEPDGEIDWDIYSPESTLRRKSVQKFQPFEIIELTDPLILFELNTSQTANIVRLTVTRNFPGKTSQLWSFNSKTLKPIGVSSLEYKFSSQVYAAQALAGLDATSSIDPLHSLSQNSPAHFVRWEAIKALALLDGDEALIAVRRALADKHPHVRHSALLAESQLLEVIGGR